ncbi:MAG: hypothetical protein QXI39_00280 [Candidatus Bathyarchaeia archaeon]
MSSGSGSKLSDPIIIWTTSLETPPENFFSMHNVAVFGMYDRALNQISIYLDNILMDVYLNTSKEKFIGKLCGFIASTLIHELIHCYNPEADEEKVEDMINYLERCVRRK